MEKNVHNLFDSEDVIDNAQETKTVEEPRDTTNRITDDENPNGNEEQDSGISKFLKSKGIKDSTKINFVDGAKDWKDLTSDEQFNVLDSLTQEEKPILSQDEVDLLNQIRESNLTPKQYINSLSLKETPEEPEQEVPTYDFNKINDDTLFVSDLLSRINIESVGDEQAQRAYIENRLKEAKEYPVIYKQEVDNIRNYYIKAQNDVLTKIKEDKEREIEKRNTEYSNKITEAIDNIKSIGNLDIDLEDEEKKEIKDLLLSKDKAGVSWLAKILNDPDTVARLGMYYLYGDKIIKGAMDYAKQENSQKVNPIDNLISKATLTINKNNKSNKSTKNKPLKMENLFD